MQSGYDTDVQLEAATTSAASRPAPRASGYVCDCLEVTECALLDVLSRSHIQTLRDVRRAIGAGDGCTACHGLLRQYLAARGAASRPVGAGAAAD